MKRIKTYQVMVIALSVFGLQGCEMWGGSHSEASASHYNYNNYYDERTGTTMDADAYASDSSPDYYVPQGRHVSVPRSYHLDEFNSPKKHKNRDKKWVRKQSPNSYTIEIANDKKASNVAKTLFKTPKNERMAQIKYKKNGKSHYRGVYGTYKSKEDARKAMQKLPAHIRNKAGVKQWNKIQTNLDTSSNNNSVNLPKIQ